MESLLKLQIDDKNLIEKGRTNFKKSPKDRITQGYLETRLETLEDQWKRFNDTHRKIIERATVDDMKGAYFSSEMYDNTEETYTIYKSELKDCQAKFSVKDYRDQPSCSSSDTKMFSVRLPKINIPTFSGNYSEWISFRDLFMSLVHFNKGLDDVQKLHYLKGCLAGEAEQLLRQIPVTAANYSVCWNQLEHRYNNKRQLANSILQRLFGQKRISSESAVTLKQLLDTTSDCMSALTNLGINVSTWDIIVIHIVASKLDQETRKQWELKVSADNPTELPTLDHFKSFIESRYRAFEFIEPQKASVQHSSSQIGRSNNYKVFTTRNNNLIQAGETAMRCEHCGEGDKLCYCAKFAKLDINQRRQFVQSNKICFNCLGGNHMVSQCRITTSCRLCRRRHHTLLHTDDTYSDVQKDQEKKQNSIPEDSEASTNNFSPVISCCSTNKHARPGQVLLATAIVKAQTATREFQLVRALLDQGSQASFITEAAVQFLGLKRRAIRGIISSLGDSKKVVADYKVTLVLQSVVNSEFEMKVEAYVLKSITSYLPEKELEPIRWPVLEHLVLADPHFRTPNRIDILLGADVYSAVLKEGIKKDPTGALVAQCTNLGWILSGVAHLKGKDMSTNRVTALCVQLNENEMLKKFWEIEEQFPPSEILTDQEKRCEELFTSTTTRTTDGRYVVRLPFKEQNPACIGGNNREIAIKRFKSLERKFARDQDLKEKYIRVINEYLELNHMRIVHKPDNNINKAVYLPHHAVIRDDKTTTKVRVVFDASCKNENGVSLNDTLMVGPTLQPDLRHIVLRWRIHRIAIVADIVKMYRQVRVAEEDVVYQRIVWRNNNDDEIQDYELLTVTFGTAPAPYLAVKALNQVALDDGKDFPTAAERVSSSFYMDDLMISCSTVEEGKGLCKEMRQLLKGAGFELQKWDSNNKEIKTEIECYEQGNLVMGNEKEKLCEDGEEREVFDNTKILGLTWCRSTDEFRYTVQLPSRSGKTTKRSIISDIARLFDPLGWIAPSIILAKILIQKLWLAGVDWDEDVPKTLKQEWDTYREDLLQLFKVRVPRWLGVTENDSSLELHGFSDASKEAYAAVVYTRYIDSSGNVNVSLLIAKTKVAPIKQISIPRLELCGALLLARLLADVAKAMNISKDNVRAWTDSTVVLAWLNSHPNRWKTFVANRVSEILTTLDADRWAHVSTKDNPADCASRGVQPNLLSANKLWFEGPQFLYNVNISYSRPINVNINLEESIKSHFGVVEEDMPWIKYSTLKKMLRVIALCRRFIYNYCKIKKDISKYIHKTELDEALMCCVRRCQKKEFNEEYTQIKNTASIKNKSSKLRSLCPFMDKDGIMRVNGRLQQASLSDLEKHPIILPHQSYLTKLLIAEAHDQTLHGGPQLMINFLRSAYWIIGVKSLVKQYVRKCVTCVKHKAKVHAQLMGSLPSARCTPTRPFLHSGVDYAGPVNIRTTKGRGHRSYKGYICVFVCMATRAIHLEVVSDMSTQGFLAAFRRFVSRRGHCAQIWSDNGTNFVGAARELKELFAKQQSIAADLETQGTVWHFIPPHAPNFGGLWEAAVRSTKFHIKRVLGDTTLTYEEMSTLLTQVEACLNSRPMTVINGEDLDEPMPLTPGHFLVGEPLISVHDANYKSSNISSLSRWQLLQKMLQNFWRRWSTEYLCNLVHRYKWSFKTPEPNIGDVVLVKEFDLPPARWLLGRIIDKHPGADNITRVVTLRTKTGILKRPTSKLCVLPVNE